MTGAPLNTPTTQSGYTLCTGPPDIVRVEAISAVPVQFGRPTVVNGEG